MGEVSGGRGKGEEARGERRLKGRGGVLDNNQSASTCLVNLLNRTRTVDEFVDIVFVYLKVGHDEREEGDSLPCSGGHLKNTVTLWETVLPLTPTPGCREALHHSLPIPN